MGNRLLFLLLALLGFTSCEKQGATYYGSPSTDFTIKGRVTDAQGNPVQGIQVTPMSFKDPSSTSPAYKFQNPQPVLSDKSGLYVVKEHTGTFGAPFDLQLQFEDIDGAENGGLFITKQSTIPVRDENLTEKGDWNSKYEKTADDTQLEKVKEK